MSHSLSRPRLPITSWSEPAEVPLKSGGLVHAKCSNLVVEVVWQGEEGARSLLSATPGLLPSLLSRARASNRSRLLEPKWLSFSLPSFLPSGAFGSGRPPPARKLFLSLSLSLFALLRGRATSSPRSPRCRANPIHHLSFGRTRGRGVAPPARAPLAPPTGAEGLGHPPSLSLSLSLYSSCHFASPESAKNSIKRTGVKDCRRRSNREVAISLLVGDHGAHWL